MEVYLSMPEHSVQRLLRVDLLLLGIGSIAGLIGQRLVAARGHAGVQLADSTDALVLEGSRNKDGLHLLFQQLVNTLKRGCEEEVKARLPFADNAKVKNTRWYVTGNLTGLLIELGHIACLKM